MKADLPHNFALSNLISDQTSKDPIGSGQKRPFKQGRKKKKPAAFFNPFKPRRRKEKNLLSFSLEEKRILE